MTPRDFCYWLQGYFELLENKNPGLSEKQVEVVREHLRIVFNSEDELNQRVIQRRKDIDKSMAAAHAIRLNDGIGVPVSDFSFHVPMPEPGVPNKNNDVFPPANALLEGEKQFWNERKKTWEHDLATNPLTVHWMPGASC